MKFYEHKAYLIAEFILLFIGVPLFIMYGSALKHPSTVLLPIVIFLIIYLKKQNLNWEELKKLNINRKFLITNIFLILLSSFLIFAGVYYYARNYLFDLPRLNFKIWLSMFILYPVFSASLQEMVFRVFLFKRYKTVFSKPWLIILASGIVFSFAHIFYLNVLSLILTLIMGLYLAYIYHKNRSFLFISIIHSFYGNLIFTIGLGQFFWIDMYKYLQ